MVKLISWTWLGKFVCNLVCPLATTKFSLKAALVKRANWPKSTCSSAVLVNLVSSRLTFSLVKPGWKSAVATLTSGEASLAACLGALVVSWLVACSWAKATTTLTGFNFGVGLAGSSSLFTSTLALGSNCPNSNCALVLALANCQSGWAEKSSACWLAFLNSGVGWLDTTSCLSGDNIDCPSVWTTGWLPAAGFKLVVRLAWSGIVLSVVACPCSSKVSGACGVGLISSWLVLWLTPCSLALGISCPSCSCKFFSTWAFDAVVGCVCKVTSWSASNCVFSSGATCTLELTWGAVFTNLGSKTATCLAADCGFVSVGACGCLKLSFESGVGELSFCSTSAGLNLAPNCSLVSTTTSFGATCSSVAGWDGDSNPADGVCSLAAGKRLPCLASANLGLPWSELLWPWLANGTWSLSTCFLAVASVSNLLKSKTCSPVTSGATWSSLPVVPKVGLATFRGIFFSINSPP